MEDGVLAAPAPYSAPAAYYFPNAGRMYAIEVLKGSSQVQYGPFTTGGAINMVSTPIPTKFSAKLNASYGSYNTLKTYASIGNSFKYTGFLVEYLRYQSDGFRKDEPNERTGFKRNDLLVKFSAQTNNEQGLNHIFELKFGFANETSDETYLGLSESDFAKRPYYRYAGAQKDNLITRHTQWVGTYLIEANNKLKITTNFYYNFFFRNWYKLNEVRAGYTKNERRSIEAVLADPETNKDYFDIVDNYDRLKGRTDYIHFLETQRNEVVLLRDNDDLIIRTLDGVNQVTVRKHFSEAEPWHAINGIRFADDDTWHPPHHHNNHAPEVVQPLDNLAVKAGSEVNGQITLSAISDPDGETLAYQLTMTDGIPLPDWLKFDAQTGAISGQAPTDSSLLNLRLTGTDHVGASAFADFTLQVNAAPKVAHPLDNRREVEDRDFSFQLPQDTFTDPESDPLNLQLVQGNGEALPGWLHFDAASGTVSGHAPVGSPDLSLSLIATDPLGNQSHADFSLALTAPPQTVKSSWHGGTIYGKDGNDHLIGSNFNDRIHGGDGDDYLKAKFGNDVLDGGKGNDRLLGDWGNDEYFYRAGDGHDTIQDSQGKDTLILDGIRHSDTRFLLRGKDLVLEFTQDGGSIVIENHTGSGRMEHFRFADLHLDHRAVEDLMRRLSANHGVI